MSREVAHLDAEVEVEAATAGPARVTVDYRQSAFAQRKCRHSSRPLANLHPGNNVIDLRIEIRQPKLWYPAGYGDQPLYEFTAQLGPPGQMGETRAVKAGLRSIVLDRHLDQWGRSFQLVVNGIPVFAKGADVIPFDSFPNRVTTADYRRILESARDANMNMIRHWGGGYYETDEFYQICDELGIMVWQDFMFGNDWQPGTYAFKLNIEAEAEDQVRRLRNHPSIVVWCGNNETEEALNWGDRAKLAPDVKFQMWQDYLTEFSGILTRVVARLDSGDALLAQLAQRRLRDRHANFPQRRRSRLGRVARPRAVLDLRNASLALRHRVWLPVLSRRCGPSKPSRSPKTAPASSRL